MASFINDSNGVPILDETPTGLAGLALETRAELLSTVIGDLSDHEADNTAHGITNYLPLTGGSLTGALTIIDSGNDLRGLFNSFPAMGGFAVASVNAANNAVRPMAINPYGGNVGIGLAAVTPANRLDVLGAATSGSEAVARFSSAADYPSISVNATKAAGLGQPSISFAKNGTAQFSLGNDFSADGTRNFFIYDNVATSARLFINSSGSVGVGNNSPLAKLHVGAGSDALAIPETALLVTNAGTTNIAIRDATNNVEMMHYAYSGGGILGTNTNHDLFLRTNNTNRAAISAAGDLQLLGNDLKMNAGGGTGGGDVCMENGNINGVGSGNGQWSNRLYPGGKLEMCSLDIHMNHDGMTSGGGDLFMDNGSIVCAGGVQVNGDVSATYFYGDGSNLTGIVASWSGGNLLGANICMCNGTGGGGGSIFMDSGNITCGNDICASMVCGNSLNSCQYNSNGLSGFTGDGSYTCFCVCGGIIVGAS